MAELGQQVEKLDKDNYPIWKFRMTNYLMGKGLWGMVSGEDAQPKIDQATTTEAQRRQGKEWEERNRKVMFLISQVITNSMVGHIQHLKIAKDAWETLERIYSTNTKARKLQLS